MSGLRLFISVTDMTVSVALGNRAFALSPPRISHSNYCLVFVPEALLIGFVIDGDSSTGQENSF